MNNKEISKEKLNIFLDKINKKLDSSNEVNQQNKETIKNWINDFKNDDNPKLKISYNNEIYMNNLKENKEHIEQLFNNNINQQNINENNNNIQKENKSIDKEKFENELNELINKMINENTNIPEKENIFHKIETNFLIHKNIYENLFNIEKFENIMINLLNSVNENEEEKELNTKNEINPLINNKYINSITGSISLMSLLMLRLITIKNIYNDYILEEKNKLEKYILLFIEKFKKVFFGGDFRIRTTILTHIGNFTSFMLFTNKEKELNEIIKFCFNEFHNGLKIVKENYIKKINISNNQNHENIFQKDLNNSSSNLTTDASKNILIEIIKRLPITEDYCLEIQKTFKENFEKILSIFDVEENNTIISMLFIIYELFFYFLNMKFFLDYIKSKEDFANNFLPKLSVHLSYTSPRLRFWIINFLLYFNKVYDLKSNKLFMDKILPLICLNRYLQVEGVKKNSMTLWKNIAENKGIEIIRDNYENYLTAYIHDLTSIGQSEKEAACRCMQELIIKVYDEKLHKNIVQKYSDVILNDIIKCCHDNSYLVRESGLISLSYIYDNLKEKINNELLNDIILIIKYHCFDNILEVRDASAFALKIFIQKGGILEEKYENYFRELVENLNDNNKIDNYIQEIRKEIFPYITEKQDFGFLREVDAIDFKEGIVHIIKELGEIDNCFIYKNLKKEELLMIVIDFLCKNYHNGLTNINKKVIWEALTVLFLKINKYDIELYIDYIIDILIKELDLNLNSLSGYQAEKFILALIEGGVNKRMIKSKIKNKIKGKMNLINYFNNLLK